MAIQPNAGNQPFSIVEAWAYPYSTGAPGTGLVLPGIVQITGDPQNTVVEHRGGGTVLAKVASFDSIDLTLTLAVWDFAGIAALVGGEVTASLGVTPNQHQAIIHRSTDAPADCAIVVQTRSRSSDGGGSRLAYPRCQPQNIPSYGLNDQEFVDLDMPMSAVADTRAAPNDNVMVIPSHWETYTPLTSTYTPGIT